MRSPEETNDNTVGPAGPHLDEGTVHAWLDGQLSPAEGAALEAHAAACAACAALVAEARGLVAGATRILGALDLDSGSRGAASDAAAAGPVAPTVVPIATRRRRRWMVPSAIAATLLVGALTLLNQPQHMARDGSALVATSAPESAPTADTAPSPVPNSVPSPLRVTSPEVAATKATMPASGGGGVGAATGQDERLAQARKLDLARPIAPSEATVANAAPAPAPPATSSVAAAPDTVAAKAAARSAFAEARRDSAQSVAPLAADRQFSARREAAPIQGRVSGVAAGAAAPAGVLSISGRVVDANRVPVQGATVSIAALNVGTYTNTDGRYTLVLPATTQRPDSVAVVVRHIGYEPARQTVASAGGVATADFALRQSVTALEAVVVSDVNAQKPSASATAVPQCYAVSRPPAGVPAAFVLDAEAGRAFVRAGTRAGAGAEVGNWSASGGAVTATFTATGGPRLVTFAPPAVGASVQTALGSGETVTIRRVACGR